MSSPCGVLTSYRTLRHVRVLTSTLRPCADGSFSAGTFLFLAINYSTSVAAAAAATALFCRHRRVKKEDMRRIAKATGASIVTTLADMEGNETFDADVLGEAEEVRGSSQDVTCFGMA